MSEPTNNGIPDDAPVRVRRAMERARIDPEIAWTHVDVPIRGSVGLGLTVYAAAETPTTAVIVDFHLDKMAYLYDGSGRRIRTFRSPESVA